MGEIDAAGPYADITEAAYAYGRVHQAAQVDIGQLQNRLRRYWLERDMLRQEAFRHEVLQIGALAVQYGEIRARRVVFCEGWRATQNPYFQYLPFACTKGEALEIRLPDRSLQAILKHRIFFAPLPADRIWIGATSTRDFTDEQTTAAALAYFREQLTRLLRLDYDLLAHRAAVRPTVRDRRPLLGQHPREPRLYCCNGMGTKGASLAPYWVEKLVDLLEAGVPLDRRVDIRRFSE